MFYLGQEEGRHYVLSSVSSMMSPEDGSRLRVRSVVINTLEGTKRANGKTWMEALNQAALPFGPADAGETDGTEMRHYEADRTVEVNGVTLHYAAVGEGRPVILLHGNGEDHDLFDTQITQLVKAGYRVYAPDTRGHGANEPLAEYHYADMAEDIYQFIMALGLEEKPALYGHSDGGITALLLELNHPGTQGAMAISGTNLSPAGLDPAFVEPYEKQNAEHPDPLVTLMLTEPHIDPEALAAIDIPVLVTAGERDLILREETERLAAALPNAALVIVPDADHGSYIVNDLRMGALLIPFLAQNWYTSPLIPLPAESPDP